MLILSRNRNETIVIGDDVKVTVLDILVEEATVNQASVRLGIQAPRDLAVHRQEIFDRINSPKPAGTSKAKPKRSLPGRREAIHGAVVRLRIQAPPATSIQCSRASTDAALPQRLDLSLEADSREVLASGASKDLTVQCRKDDHFLIGNQLVLMIVDVGRYVVDRPVPKSQ